MMAEMISARGHLAAGRFRAQRHLPGPRPGAPGRCRPHHPDRFGRPFPNPHARRWPQATPEQAVAHPNWDMGAKISVDSATMMNKGLEIIEAQHLFGMTEDRIEVLVHPQSVVHSAVAYIDGSGPGADGQPGHAYADRLYPGLAGAHGGAGRAPRPGGDRRAHLRGARSGALPRPAPWLARPCGSGERHRPFSTPRTRSQSTVSLTGALGFLEIAEVVERTMNKACRWPRPRGRRGSDPHRWRGAPDAANDILRLWSSVPGDGQIQ